MVSFKSKIYQSIKTAATTAVLVLSTFLIFEMGISIYHTIHENLMNEVRMMAFLIEDRLSILNTSAQALARDEKIVQIVQTKSYDNYDERFKDIQTIYVNTNSIEIKKYDVPLYIMSMNNPMLRFTNQENFLSVYGDKNGYGFQKMIEASHTSPYYVHRGVVGEDSKETVLTIIHAIRKKHQDSIEGYVFLDVYQSFFDKIFTLSSYDKSNIYIMYQDEIVCDKNNDLSSYPKLTRAYERPEYRGGNVYFSNKMSDSFTLTIEIPFYLLYRDVIKVLSVSTIILFFIRHLSSYMAEKLSDKISAPLNELVSAMASVEHGDVSTEIKHISNIEIEEILILNKQFNQMTQSIEQLIEQVYKKQLTIQKAEMKALKFKFNPHFVNNTLESAKWLIRKGEYFAAEEMISDLGRLLSRDLFQDDFITVKEEMVFIDHYLSIQEKRYADKLTYEYKIEDECLNVLIPNFLVQPLVENALKHGVENNLHTTKVTISILKKGQALLIRVEDTAGKLKQSSKGHGVGLHIVSEILEHHYGVHAQLSIYLNSNRHTVQEILIERGSKNEHPNN